MAPTRKKGRAWKQEEEAVPKQEPEFEQTDANNEDMTTVITVSESGTLDEAGTYYIDEQGRYYYTTSSGGAQNIVALNNAVNENGENNLLLEESTMTVLQTEGANGDMNVVLVVQEPEDTKPIITNIENSTEDPETNSITIYDFDEAEEEVEEEQATDEEGGSETDNKPQPPKRRGPRFTCTYCTYASHRRYLLIRHMKSHSQERPHKCTVCERGFKTFAALQNHVNTHTGIKPHTCKYCSNKFTTSGELVRHIRYRHTHEKPHKCEECDYASVELSKLRRHMRCHTGERPYQCPHCTYASPDTFKLKRHLRIHTGEKPYQCDVCSQSFTQSNSLKNHKLIHFYSDKPVFACELCPTTCGRKTDLRIHIQKLHTADKPLKCKRCGKSFPDRYSYKVHKKTHDGEKCFKCQICPYASTTQRHLESHLLKHSDEKPFICTFCDQAFRQKQLLKRHLNLYHNPNFVPNPPREKTHECHECKRTFAHKGNLIRHMSVHDPEVRKKMNADMMKSQKKSKPETQKKVVRFKRPEPVEEIEDDEESVEEEVAEEEDEEEVEDNDNDMMSVSLTEEDLKRGKVVEDDDGKNYLLLEVIQLPDGSEQVSVVAAEDPGSDDNAGIENPLSVKHGGEAAVVDCFGFDEGEENDEDELEGNRVVISFDISQDSK